jgi:ribonuclease J
LDKGTLQVIPLGGLGEIGKNMTALKQSSGILLVDAGMSFPEEELPGIDLVLPDFSYLRGHKGELRGVVLTHGHEDHVGSLPYLLREFRVPVYGTKLTLGLVRPKLAEAGIKNPDLRELSYGQKENFHGFGVELIEVNHSIPDAAAVAVRTQAGLVVFSGDYKVDLTPIEGRPMDLARLAELGKEGVLALFGDSTNAEREGHTPSESVVQRTFESVFERAGGRIIVASFASHIHRISQVVEAAKRHGRLVGVTGRSMIRNVQIARELGYLDLPENMIVDQRQVNQVPDGDIVILTTGSQGEPLAALSRIASGTHKTIEIGPGDVVIVSAHPIPGNEPAVSRTINNLMKRGADVLYDAIEPVHVSGHGSKEEQKLLISLLKPKFMVPVHGEYRMLKRHAETAASLGIPRDNIFVLENGDRLEFKDGRARKLEPVSAGRFLVDRGGIGDATDEVVRERQKLSEEGMFIVVARVDAQTGKALGPPDVISRGFVDPRTSNGFVGDSVRVVSETLERTAKRKVTDWGALKTEIRRDLSGFLSQKTGKRPIILPLVVEV